MEDMIVIVKVKNDLQKIVDYLVSSYESKSKRYYSVNSNDALVVSKYEGLTFTTVFVLFEANERKKEDEVLKLFIGKGTIEKNDVRWIINYQIELEVSSRLVIDNFISNSELDLKNDFGNGIFVSIEKSRELIEQLTFIIKEPYVIEPKGLNEQSYPEIESEKGMSLYSQFNKHCKRVIGRHTPEDNRSEFQRDYERIVHSKAYRRLVDKAQIFTSSKGDYYRTRMTHTLEVAQIARAIAISLKVNVQLTEAIALAHDLGHTPFGHQGERTLDKILKNKIEIIKGDFSNNPFGGFKHNFQGLRVVNYLEEKYIEFEGIDLSYQVLEGILKHTKGKIKNCEICGDNCTLDCYNLQDFFPTSSIELLYPQYENATTLEGQIVALADEIAQRGHDLDDAFASQSLTIDDLIDYLSLRKMNLLKDKIQKIKEEMESLRKNNRAYVDQKELYQVRIISAVIGFFITNAIENSNETLKNYTVNDFYNNHHRFNDLLIQLSPEGKILCDYLEKIISKKVINCLETSQFDSKAALVIEGLFRAYYNNPKLLHKGSLRRLYIEMRKNTKNVIDFINGDHKIVKKELETIALMKINSDTAARSPEEQEYWLKRKVLVRVITDYISGMTDSYALNEYRNIYS